MHRHERWQFHRPSVFGHSSGSEKQSQTCRGSFARSFSCEYQVTAAANGLPAAGYRNDSSLNNAGSNGNYWSRTLNSSNPNNAWNLNFNSGDINTNNNNRNNGQSVRPVRR